MSAVTEFMEVELRTAWENRRRPDWPATFEDAMADPVYAGIVRIQARIDANAANPAAPAAPPPPLDAPACRTQNAPCASIAPSRRCANCILRPPPPQRAFVPPPGYVDVKRRASGERDDD
jgi:hypothetical protein